MEKEETPLYRTTLCSPIGMLYLASDGNALTGLWLENQKHFDINLLMKHAEETPDLPIFRQTEQWLNAYFSAAPLPALPSLAPQGSPFRRSVWTLLLTIPYGQTTTYGNLAAHLNQAGISASARAVGGAVGRNPISILIPCHRVIGANGTLTGYAGGVDTKRFLLELENAI